ncbi:MAG: helicase-related protein [Bacteroidota bacterium]|nr:helicase-related protein [Bacteroidota bacterium]
MDKGHQVYVVYPLIEESQKLDLKDLQDGYESLERYFPKPQYQLGIVHGRMHPKDKDFEMKRFASKESQILVATTVIEVGVNVPNATVLVIENAERFGLSQLHQLRGRIGRGSAKSYCILLTSNEISEVAQRRMQIMTASQDGFRIAQEDLLIRGPGDIAGTKQSGLLDFKAIDLANDTNIVHSAAKWVKAILDKDSMLEKKENLVLRNRLYELKPKWSWSEIS